LNSTMPLFRVSWLLGVQRTGTKKFLLQLSSQQGGRIEIESPYLTNEGCPMKTSYSLTADDSIRSKWEIDFPPSFAIMISLGLGGGLFEFNWISSQ
jgi:hypothetical protein